MLKIQRSSVGSGVVFSLSGRIELEDIHELRRLFQLEKLGSRLAVDLEEVTLIHRDAVKFLASCEAENIKLKNCPAYIRVWVDREAEARANRKSLIGWELAY